MQIDPSVGPGAQSLEEVDARTRMVRFKTPGVEEKAGPVRAGRPRSLSRNLLTLLFLRSDRLGNARKLKAMDKVTAPYRVALSVRGSHEQSTPHFPPGTRV